MKTARILLIAAIYFGVNSAHAVEFEHRSDVLLFGDYRNLNQNGLSIYDSTFDGWLVAGTQLRVRESDFQFEARPEIRGLNSPAAGLPNTDIGQLSVKAPRRFVNLDVKLFSDTNNQWVGDFEKLNASYGNKSFEVYAGRKPISLGVLKVLPVWNKFTRPLPNAAGPALIYSQDSAGFRSQLGDVALQAFDLEGATSADSVRLSELIWYNSAIELHGFVSRWWEKTVTGLALTKDIFGMTLRGETLWVLGQEVQGGLGGEYALNEKWSVLAEFLYLSAGTTDTGNYTVIINSRFRNLRARDYGYAQLQYNLSAFWTITAGAFTNIIDGSTLLIPKVSHSLSDDAELYFNAQIPLGTQGAELGPDAFPFPDGSSVGAPLQIAAGLKYFF